MKKEILIALVEKWRNEVKEDKGKPRSGSDSASALNAKLDGENIGLSRCADDLEKLVDLLA